MKYLLMLCIFLMQSTFWLAVYLKLYFPNIHNKVIVFLLYGSYIVFVVIYFFAFYRLIKYNQLKEEVSMLEKLKMIKQQQKESVELAIQAEQKKQDEIIEKLQLIVTQLDNNEYDKAKELFSQVYDNFKINKMKTYCDNAYVNAVLVNKESLMEQYNIKYQFEVILPQEIDLDILVLPTILFNILDNAIHACQICENKFIELSIHFTDTYISIYMKNSNSKKQETEIYGVHGYGTKIVEELVCKNNGTCEWKDNGDTFESIMMLKHKKAGDEDDHNSNS